MTEALTTRGLYAGSFDPPTNGHLAIIKADSKLFGELEVAIGVNAAKKSTFSVEEREEMLRVISQDLPSVTISNFANQFLIDYATREGFTHILRGLRSSNDYDDERQLAVFNTERNPNIETVYIPCPRELDIVSSSLVKGLRGNEGWEIHTANYVDPFVLRALERTVRQTD